MLTPVEIQGKAFKSGIGYDKKDVDAFKIAVVTDYEELYRANIELRDKVTMLNEGIQHYKNIENSLHKALVVAEQTADEVIKNAHDTAKNVEQEALLSAKEHELESRLVCERTYAKTVALIQEYNKYKAQFNQFILTQQELLNSSNFLLDEEHLDTFQIHSAE